MAARGSEEWKRKIGDANRGHKHPQESIPKMVEASSRGLHNRWHQARDLVKDGCKYCAANVLA